MGWTIHLRFLKLLGAGMISPWVYNSGISAVFETSAHRARDWAWWGLCRPAAALLVFFDLLRARRRVADPAAQRQFLFLLTVVVGLLLMPIVWEHYLSVLFIPVAYCLAMMPRLGRRKKGSRRTCLLCCTQNLIFALWLNDQLNPAGPLGQMLPAVWKSVPLICSRRCLCSLGAAGGE